MSNDDCPLCGGHMITVTTDKPDYPDHIEGRKCLDCGMYWSWDEWMAHISTIETETWLDEEYDKDRDEDMREYNETAKFWCDYWDEQNKTGG